jgi:hypothetical protein
MDFADKNRPIASQDLPRTSEHATSAAFNIDLYNIGRRQLQPVERS